VEATPDGKQATRELIDLMMSPKCALRSLDLSACNFVIHGERLAEALKGNATLTALDVRRSTQLPGFLGKMGEILLELHNTCPLAHLCCDDFELREGARSLSLSETRLEAHHAKMLAGLLRHNLILQELNLNATDLDEIGARAFAVALERHTLVDQGVPLRKLLMKHNPAVGDEATIALTAIAAKHDVDLHL
jgi:hypothetical protein